jgi:hypothetical protein
MVVHSGSWKRNAALPAVVPRGTGHAALELLRRFRCFALKREGSQMFRRRKPAPLAAAGRMGFRSILVLAKLGHDLREEYACVLDEGLPDDIAALAARLNPPVALHPAARER